MTRPVVTKVISVAFFNANVFAAYFVVVRIFPFVIILITNILLVHTLMTNTKQMIQMTSQSVDIHRLKVETAIARTVIAVTTVYFICMVPGAIILGLLRAGVFVDKYSIAFCVISGLEILYFAVNFVIYNVTSKFFRRKYRKLFYSCFCRNNQLLFLMKQESCNLIG